MNLPEFVMHNGDKYCEDTFKNNFIIIVELTHRSSATKSNILIKEFKLNYSKLVKILSAEKLVMAL